MLSFLNLNNLVEIAKKLSLFYGIIIYEQRIRKKDIK